MNNPSKLNIIFFLVGMVFFCCNEPNTNEAKQAKPEKTEPILNLSGQVYFYAPELDTNTCEAYGQCDCCTGNFLFIDESNFIIIDVCESDNWYYKGKYKIANGCVILNYDSLMVKRNYNWKNETDTNSNAIEEYSIKISKTNLKSTVLTPIICKKNICFKTDDKQTAFVTLDKTQKLSEWIKQLKEEGIWEKLKIK
jgi:hypothetical protein